MTVISLTGVNFNQGMGSLKSTKFRKGLFTRNDNCVMS